MRAEGPITSPPPLVIGVGNRDRGDDAVGPSVVELLAQQGGAYQTRIVEGDLSDLVLRWGPNQDVIVVDAMRSGRPPGTVRTLDGLDCSLPTDPSLLSSHGVGLAEAVELGRLLNRLPRSLLIVGVEAQTFAHFEEMSEPVRRALPDVVDQIGEVLEDLVDKDLGL